MDRKNSLLTNSSLSTMTTDDIIKMNAALDEEMKKREIKKAVDMVHTSKIIKEKSGNREVFATKVWTKNGTTKKRKTIRGRTMDDLYSALYVFYIGRLNVEKLTMKDIFQEYVEYRLELKAVKAATVRKDTQEWNRWIKNEKIASIPIQKISVKDFKNWAYKAINSQEIPMKRKAFNNVKGVVIGLIDYYIEEYEVNIINPARNVKFNSSVFSPAKKGASKLPVYQTHEATALVKKAFELADTENDELYLAIPLMLCAGTRVGETLALNFTDFDKQAHKLNVSKSIKPNDKLDYEDLTWKRNFMVSNTLKRNLPDREVAVGKEIETCLDAIKSILSRKGIVRINLFSQNSPKPLEERLKALCGMLNLEYKTPTGLRKTYASHLYATTKDLKLVAKQLGHNNLVTAPNHYIYALDSNDEVLEKSSRINYLQAFGTHWDSDPQAQKKRKAL